MGMCKLLHQFKLFSFSGNALGITFAFLDRLFVFNYEYETKMHFHLHYFYQLILISFYRSIQQLISMKDNIKSYQNGRAILHTRFAADFANLLKFAKWFS